MKVIVPSQLHDYTAGRSEIMAEGETVAAVIDDLDRRYPGLRFRVTDEQGRIRRHIRFFINSEPALALDCHVAAGDELLIVAALSGG